MQILRRYDLERKINFGPFNFNHEYTTRIQTVLATEEQALLVKRCSMLTQINTDLSFSVQRDDSYHSSKVRYLRLDAANHEDFVFQGGYTDHTRLEFNGTHLVCRGTVSSSQCNHLTRDHPVKAIVLSIDFNPRDGKAHNDMWTRNQYRLKGTYYKVSCKSGIHFI